MKQKHRKWAGVLLAGAMMLLSATGSSYAAENNGHSAYARYLAGQRSAAFIAAAPAQATAAFGDSTASAPAQVTAASGTSVTSAVPAVSRSIVASNPTDQDFVPLFGQISLSSDFHTMLHQWNESVKRPLREMAALLSDSQQSAAETLLRNLNTAKTSEDKSSGSRMVQTR